VTPRPVDGLFISYYEDIDRWGNDHAPSRSGPTGSPAYLAAEQGSGKDTLTHRMGRQSVGIDGMNHDISRYLSRARYGTSIEYRRYDAFSPTHLSGAYYESLAKRHGYDLHHINHASRVDLERLAPQLAPRFVFLSTTYMTETSMALDAAQHVRANWPGVPVIMGGLVLVELEKSLPEAVFQTFLKAWGADAYVITPLGEAAFLRLLESDGTDIPGLGLPKTWVKRDGRYVVDETIDEPGLDIDENYVRWELLEPERLYHTVHTRTARSCAFTCSFCSYFSNQGPLVLSDPATLDMELQRLTSIGSVKSLIFTDDTLNVPMPRFLELLEVLKRYDFEWYSYFRAQFADEDCAKSMVDSGCKAVFLGIESLDDKVLKNMKKAATRKAYTRGMRALKAANINTHANFIVGFPGDQPENTRAAIDWVDSEGVEFFTFSPWYCSPATPIGKQEQKDKYGVRGNFWRWEHDTMNSSQALEHEMWAIENAKASVFVSELSAQCFWSEIQLYTNGFNAGEIQQLMTSFNGLAGDNRSMDEVSQLPAFQETQRILRTRELPVPPGCELYRTEAESQASIDQAAAKV